MAKLDFPDRDQSPWTNPDTGITYVWKGGTQGAWHIALAGDTDIFVAKTGDKMTGDLTLGPEGDTKITLDATIGSAEFASNIVSTGNVVLNGPGANTGFYVREGNSGDYGCRLVANGAATFANNDISFGADGSATFTNTVTIGPGLPASTAIETGLVARSNDSDNSSYKAAIYAQNWAAGGNIFVGFSHETAGTATRTSYITGNGAAFFAGGTSGRSVTIQLEPDNDDNYTVTTEEYTETETYTGPLGNTLEREVTKTRDIRTYTGPTLDVKERLQNLIARLDSLEAEELADDATSTLLLTTVNNLNADMTKTKAALTAIRTAANAAGTLEQLKADIVTATADI